eukprot:s3995_g7.t1
MKQGATQHRQAAPPPRLRRAKGPGQKHRKERELTSEPNHNRNPNSNSNLRAMVGQRFGSNRLTSEPNHSRNSDSNSNLRALQIWIPQVRWRLSPVRPELSGGTTPKRPRLLLDRPSPAGSPSTSSQLYPPGYAGVKQVQVHGDIPTEELVDFEGWEEELVETLYEESQGAENHCETWWDEFAEKPPELSPESLFEVDRQADHKEVTCLIQMGVARHPRENEDLSEHALLTTKFVKDWRRRPGWTRRSRLVAREFRTLAAWTSELFAPASSLAVVHSLIAYAISNSLELVTVDVKDAYLTVDQPTKVIIEVPAEILNENDSGMTTLVLDRLLPGQRIGASAWYEKARGILLKAHLESFDKEPTLFRHRDPEKP